MKQNTYTHKHLFVLLDSFNEHVLTGSAEVVNFLSTLEELESGHGRNSAFFGDLTSLININLDETDSGVPLAQSLENGANHLARSTPGGSEVNADELVSRLSEHSIEISEGLKMTHIYYWT